MYVLFVELAKLWFIGLVINFLGGEGSNLLFYFHLMDLYGSLVYWLGDGLVLCIYRVLKC